MKNGSMEVACNTFDCWRLKSALHSLLLWKTTDPASVTRHDGKTRMSQFLALLLHSVYHMLRDTSDATVADIPDPGGRCLSAPRYPC